MKRKMIFISFILAFLITLGMNSLPSVSSISAESVDNGYTIENYHVSVVVDETNTYTITEELTVSFGSIYYGESRGIYRYIPDQLTVARDVNGTWKDYYYNVNINLLQAMVVENGTSYEEAFHEDGNLVILIRENQLVNGKTRNYKIQYEYEIGNDRVKDYDELYLNLLGDQWNTYVEQFSFSITMPKAFENQPVFYSGNYGNSEQSNNVTYEVNNNVITGFAKNSLAPFSAFTIRLQLPQGYYSQVKNYSTVWDIAIIALSVLALVVVVLMFITKRKHKPVVVTVEFYPPNNIDPVHAVYSLNGYANAKNLTSLIIYFASKGYLNIIEDDNKNLSLQKLKDIPNDVPSYQKTIFNALFENCKQENGKWESVSLSSLEKTIFNQFLLASTTVNTECGGRYDHKSVWQTVKMMLISVVPFALFSLLYAIRISNVEVLAVVGTLLIMFSSFASIYSNSVIISSKNTTLFKIVFLTMFGLGAFLIYKGYWETMVDPLLLKIWTLIPLLVGFYLAPKMKHFNDEYTSIIGRVLGFRKNILLVEKKRMEMLLKDDPSYFYNILPYAYVFNITSEFSEKFEGLAMEQPSWYITTQPMSVFHAVMFANLLHSNISSFGSKIVSRSGGSGFGGASVGGGFGGGFSGGGFGGGGGGRA